MMFGKKAGFKWLCGALCLSQLTLALGGCATGETASSQPTAVSKAADGSPAASQAETGAWSPTEKITIRFDTWGLDTDRGINGYQKILDLYMERQPNVTVELTPIQWEDARTWLTMQMTGNSAPEVFHSKLPWAQEDLAKGLVQDLQEVLKEISPYMPDSQDWGSTFAPAVMRQLPDSSGKISSVCPYTNIVKVFYNKAMFEKAGITKTPETWTEFLDVQKKISGQGAVPFAFPNSKPADNVYNWVERIMTFQLTEQLILDLDVNGDGFVRTNEICRGIDEGIIDITKTPFKDGFPLLKEWSQYWSKGYNSIDASTAQQMFIRQEAAMFFGFPSTIEAMNDAGVSFDYGVFTFPYLTKENDPNACEKKYEMGSQVAEVYCIPAGLQGEQYNAAKDLLMFLTSKEAMQIAAETLYQMPTLAEKVTDKLDGWAPEGEDIKFNFYGPAVDQKFADDSVMFGQLYIEGKISLEEYTQELQNSALDMSERLKAASGWTKENNYLIE